MARLDSAARQMAAFAQSNRLRQLASLMVARNSPAEELQELRELFSGAPSLPASLPHALPYQRLQCRMGTKVGRFTPSPVILALLSFFTQKLAVMMNS